LADDIRHLHMTCTCSSRIAFAKLQIRVRTTVTLMRGKPPKDLARLVKKRVKQIPRPRSLRLRLPVR
jgi:hypothetical protein